LVFEATVSVASGRQPLIQLRRHVGCAAIQQRLAVAREIKLTRQDTGPHELHQVCVLRHEIQALGRKRWIERHVSSTALVNAQECGKHAGFPVRAQADALTAAHAACTQGPRNAVRAGVQLRVGQRPVAGPQRHTFRRALNLPLKHMVDERATDGRPGVRGARYEGLLALFNVDRHNFIIHFRLRRDRKCLSAAMSSSPCKNR
jgi:hypothetical protein